MELISHGKNNEIAKEIKVADIGSELFLSTIPISYDAGVYNLRTYLNKTDVVYV